MMTPNSRSCHSSCWGEGLMSVKFWAAIAPQVKKRTAAIRLASRNLCMRAILSRLGALAGAIHGSFEKSPNFVFQHHRPLVFAALQRTHRDLFIAVPHRT